MIPVISMRVRPITDAKGDPAVAAGEACLLRIMTTVPRAAIIILLVLEGLVNTSFAAAQQDQANGEPLKQLSLADLGNVEVTTASKEPEEVWKTPAAVFVITQDAIRRSGATSIPEVLRLAPGVEVAQVDSDHWSVGIRGFGAVLASKLLVLIDGRSVYTPLFAGVYWQAQATPLEDIERIEVIRGPGGTIWGANAVDGIINIITKSAKDTHGGLASLGGGNVDQGTSGFRYGDANGRGFNYRVYGMGFDRGGGFHPAGTSFDEWRMGQAGFRTDWDEGARDTLTFQGDIYDEGAGEATTYALYSPSTQVNTYGTADLTGGNLLGRWKRVVNQGSDFQLQAYFDRTNHFEPEFGETRDTFDVDFLDHLTLLGQQNFLWGLGARVSPSNLIQRVPSIDFLPQHRTDLIYSGFVQDEIAFFDHRLSVTVGTKLEHNNYTGFEVQPSGRVLWNRSPRESFWGSVTRAVRTPSRLDTDVELTDYAGTSSGLPVYLRVNGNPQFRSEELIAYETGYRRLVTPHCYVDVALFYNNYDDLYSFQVGAPFLETSPAPAHAVIPLLTSNGIQGNTKGFEVSPDWKPVNGWELRASYSYLDMELKNKESSNDPTSVAGYEGSSPRHQLVVRSFVNLPKKMEFDQTYRYVSALPAQTVGGYQTMDTRFGWHMTPELELSVGGQNLLQPHFAQFGGDPGGPVEVKRSAYAKLVWRFGER
jgi:iron complex outermembrane receptor protein